MDEIQRMCVGKRRYPDDMVARAAGQFVSSVHQVTLYIYPCELCRGWHLTRRRQNRKDHAVAYQFAPTPR